jgi:ferrous iron transport protein A
MDASATPPGLSLEPGFVSLAALPPGTRGAVVGVGSRAGPLTALERRLLEFGFVPGEQVEIIAEARPGRDPFVVRIGHTTLALRRREAQSVWVNLQAQVGGDSARVNLQHPVSSTSAQAQGLTQLHPAESP